MKISVRKIRDISASLSAVLTLCFLLLFMARDVMGVSVNKFIFVLLAAMICFLVDKNHMYQFVALISPLFGGLPGSYIMCIVLIFLLFKEHRGFSVDKTGFLLCCGIILIELASFVWGDFDVVEYITFVGVFFATFLFVLDREPAYEYDKMMRNFVVGIMLAFVNLLGQTLRLYSFADFLALGVRFGSTVRSFGVEKEGVMLIFNANGLGVLCTMGILSCMVMFHRTKVPLYPISMICMVWIGFLTQSRAFIIVTVLGILLYVYCTMYSLKQFFITLSTMCIACIVLYAVIQATIPHYIEDILLRFQADDVSGGRIDIFLEYMTAQLERPWMIPLGVGIQNYTQKIGASNGAHMALQQLAVTWGIVGLSIIVALVVLMVKKLQYFTRKEYLFVLPFICMLIFMQSIPFMTSNNNILYFVPMYACAKLGGIQHGEVFVKS